MIQSNLANAVVAETERSMKLVLSYGAGSYTTFLAGPKVDTICESGRWIASFFSSRDVV